MKWFYKPRKKIVFAVVLVLALPLLYPFSIYARGTLVPWYVHTFYRGSVDKAHSRIFANLNSQLHDLGFINQPAAATCYNGVSDNGNAWFHYIMETVPCMKETTTNSVLLTNNFTSKWKSVAPNIDGSLKADGWVEGGNYGSQARLPALYDEYTGSERQTAYAKTQGKYICDLIFSEDNTTHTTIHEMCTRNVSFFGGYID
jgi:hypothetical protein